MKKHKPDPFIQKKYKIKEAGWKEISRQIPLTFRFQLLIIWIIVGMYMPSVIQFLQPLQDFMMPFHQILLTFF